MDKTLTTIGRIIDCDPKGIVIADELRKQAIQLALNLGAEGKESKLIELAQLWGPEGLGKGKAVEPSSKLTSPGQTPELKVHFYDAHPHD